MGKMATQTLQMEDRLARRFWIMRVMGSYSRALKRESLASATIFALPVLVLFAGLEMISHARVVTYDVLLSLLWLALAPLLIKWSAQVMREYHSEVLGLAADESRMALACADSAQRYLSRAFLKISVPLSAATFAIGYVRFTGSAPTYAALIVGAVAALFGFLAGIAFNGLYIYIRFVRAALGGEFRIRLFHFDNYLGLSGLARFHTKFLFLFFSGSLTFPVVFQSLLNNLAAAPGTISLIVSLPMGAYIGSGLFMFVSGAVRVRDKVLVYKRALWEEKCSTFEAMMSDLLSQERKDPADVETLGLYHATCLQQIYRIKDYPYDSKAVLELAGSVIIPLFVFVLQLVVS